MSHASLSPEQVLDWMQVPGMSVYVLGCFSRPLTFHSQQQRALNLLWALAESGKVSTDDRVAVVGGGLAGLTAAAAAVRKGCKLTLLEKSQELLHLQWGNKTRYVHPHLYDWPLEACDSTTSLPFFNWEAGDAGNVMRQILSQWRAVVKHVETVMNCKIASVDSKPGEEIEIVSSDKGFRGRYKCVILAVGFGLEKPLEPVPFCSYWGTRKTFTSP